MNLSVGIVGLPNAGKSTVFNALVMMPRAKTGKYPFTTVEKNVGVVHVPDDVLVDVATMENIAKVTPASITFIDIAGLIKGAHTGEGLGNQFLHHIREVDLILHVVRFFKDENVPHVHAQVDPIDDIEIINDELLLSDLATLDKRLTREKVISEEREVVQKFINALNKGQLASTMAVSEKELSIIRHLTLLTAKKQILLANIGEEDINNPQKEIGDRSLVTMCARLEAELVQFPWTEQQRFFKEYGLAKSAKEKVIGACYHALDIVTFYTIAKHKEARAWPIKRGASAVEAAGKIHTDFAAHFIKAEVIGAKELLAVYGWHKAKEAGRVRLEGRDYIVQDGDVVEFKIGA